MSMDQYPGEIFYSETMRRLQKMEDMASKFDTHVATEDLKFASLSTQITQLGEKLDGRISELSERVGKIDQKTQENSAQLSAVLNKHAQETASASNRKKWFWRIVAIVGIPMAGFLTRFGEAIWEVLVK